MCTLGSYGPLRGGGGVMVEQEEGKGGGPIPSSVLF